jgi:hypothetical protein
VKVTYHYTIYFVGEIEAEVEPREGEAEHQAYERVRRELKAQIDAEPVTRAAASTHAETEIEAL